MIRKILNILIGVIFVLYPLGVFLGFNYFEPRFIGMLLLVFFTLRGLFFINKNLIKNLYQLAPIAIAVFVTSMAVIIFNENIFLRLHPVLISLAFLFSFGYTLIKPPSMVERFARLKDPQLSNDAIAYTKTVTKVWCLFFILNGSAAAYTTFYASFEVWTIYNGLISYILMGILFITEFIVRHFKIISTKQNTI
ncbi:MAG: hypothetical protein OEZ13_06580 [Spirochaetia bacterium]|nr:hypothetical protein [Spirochaetia bacterium]